MNTSEEPSRLQQKDSVVTFASVFHRPKTRAFTRIELLSICAALGLLALLVAPSVASNKTDSERFICFNNLRLIGRAVQMWAGDHQQHPPWRTWDRDGGLLPSSGNRAGNAWFDFAYMSNQVLTPNILACPSDVGVVRARDWDEFRSVNFRGNAVSYVVGLESVGDLPRSWVSGDRNLRSTFSGGGCSARVNNINGISSPSYVAWTNKAVHGESGHILVLDGSVEFTSTPQLRTFFASPQATDNGVAHFLRAR